MKFDYQGKPVLVMEDLVAEKVIGAWPRVGEAAIRNATEFLSGKLREKFLVPEKSLSQFINGQTVLTTPRFGPRTRSEPR